MTDRIEALKAERDKLIAANAGATSWGAAVGARQERIDAIDREIRSRTVEVDPAPDGEALKSEIAAQAAEIERLNAALNGAITSAANAETDAEIARGKLRYVIEERDKTFNLMLARATAAEAEVARLLPWARLGSAIMQDYPEYGSLDGFDIHDLAEAAGVLVKINGGFDPEKHYDITGEADPGSEWYEMLGRPDALATERKP